MKNTKLQKIIIAHILAQPNQSISEHDLITRFEHAGYDYKEISFNLFELKKAQMVESFNSGDSRISPTIYELTDKAFVILNKTPLSGIKSIINLPLVTGIIGAIVGSLVTRYLG